MKCLITGFAPMCGRESNKSWEVAQAAGLAALSGCGLTAVQLPVSFSWAPEVLRQSVHRLSPDIVLMLGESGAADKIKLERTALNMMDAVMPDNDGVLPCEAPIDQTLPAAYISPLPLKEIRDAVAGEDIAVKISNSCGLYVCNRVYFEAMSICANECPGMKALFVHLPREGMPTEVCVRAVEKIVSFLNDYVHSKQI